MRAWLSSRSTTSQRADEELHSQPSNVEVQSTSASSTVRNTFCLRIWNVCGRGMSGRSDLLRAESSLSGLRPWRGSFARSRCETLMNAFLSAGIGKRTGRSSAVGWSQTRPIKEQNSLRILRRRDRSLIWSSHHRPTLESSPPGGRTWRHSLGKC